MSVTAWGCRTFQCTRTRPGGRRFGRDRSCGDPLAFEQLEEALGHCVVMAVAAATHAGQQTVSVQEGLPVVTAVLTARVRVNDDLVLGLASPQRHQQRIEHEFAIDARLHRPADHLPREQIEHHRQIQHPS